jgi:hypothetical protein
LHDKKCTSLPPGVVTFGLNGAADGQSFLYAVPSPGDVRLPTKLAAAETVGQPQVALKLPFAFPLVSGGSAYDLSRDLSK